MNQIQNTLIKKKTRTDIGNTATISITVIHVFFSCKNEEKKIPQFTETFKLLQV